MKQRDIRLSLERRLAGYGAMSLAVASGVLAAPANAASIIFTDTSLWAGNNTATGDVFFNPATGTFGHSSTAAFHLFHNPTNSGSGSNLLVGGLGSGNGVGVTAGGFIRPFAYGSVVSSVNFAGLGRVEASDGGGNHLGNFNAGDIGYVGFFEGGNYGWARIGVLSGYQAELLSFAYQTSSGSPIDPGQSPEPASLMLLALGAAGIAAYRRKLAHSVAK